MHTRLYSRLSSVAYSYSLLSYVQCFEVTNNNSAWKVSQCKRNISRRQHNLPLSCKVASSADMCNAEKCKMEARLPHSQTYWPNNTTLPPKQAVLCYQYVLAKLVV